LRQLAHASKMHETNCLFGLTNFSGVKGFSQNATATYSTQCLVWLPATDTLHASATSATRTLNSALRWARDGVAISWKTMTRTVRAAWQPNNDDSRCTNTSESAVHFGPSLNSQLTSTEQPSKHGRRSVLGGWLSTGASSWEHVDGKRLLQYDNRQKLQVAAAVGGGRLRSVLPRHPSS